MPEIVTITQWGIVAIVASGVVSGLVLMFTGLLTNRSAAHNAETAMERMGEQYTATLQALTSTRTVDTLSK